MITPKRKKSSVMADKKVLSTIPIKSKKQNRTENHVLLDRLRIAWLILAGSAILFLLLSLLSYSKSDPGWTIAHSQTSVQNYAGIVGAYVANAILFICGIFGFLLPFILIYGVWGLFKGKNSFAENSLSLMIIRFIGLVIILLTGSGLAEIFLPVLAIYMPQNAGGVIGEAIANQTVLYLNITGGIFTLFASFILGLTLFSGNFWLRFLVISIHFCLKKTQQITGYLRQKRHHPKIQQQSPTTYQAPNPFSSVQRQPDAAPAYEEFEITKNKTDDEEFEITKNKTDSECDAFLKNKESSSLSDEISPLEVYEPSPPPSQGPDYTEPAEKKVLNNNFIEPEITLSPTISNNLNISKPSQNPKTMGGHPTLELLDEPIKDKETVSTAFLQKTADLVEEKLADFGVYANVVGSYPGPVVIRFEIELAPGVKASKLSGLSQDLARSLSAARVRVVEVIPGKPYVGLEIPNAKREIVRLKEILDDKKFNKSTSPLTIGLGVDISGAPKMADLAKMPHLLVAGTTGSGKSVGVNAMIISMLYKSTPDDLRLIMIDPKMLELSIYEGIPHLLTPVVTDMNDAANSLRWCVKEMDRRYALMAAAGVRNLAGLNEKIMTASKTQTPMKDPLWLKLHPEQPEDAPTLEKLPHIVVIADEFADMMMVAGKKVEELIARISQKARASGIHLILATQRPSVDVVTGLIKANIPTRIAFQVSSKIDSRTILDQQGAEQLLGHGDMLYLPPGSGVPTRIHGAFVDDDEVHRVVAAWKELGEPEYIDSITASEEDLAGEDDVQSTDPLYDDAIKIVLDTQRASISNVQRRLRIGYNRAARLIEEMESAGIVSEMQSNGMREVLLTKDPTL